MLTDPQSSANEVRELIAATDGVRRLGSGLLRVFGTESELTVRARHRDRVLEATRRGSWRGRPIDDLTGELAAELVGEALAGVPVSSTSRRWASAGPLERSLGLR